jgi:deoxyribonuclease V
MWPPDAESLRDAQYELARLAPSPWQPPADQLSLGGCWVCFPRGLRGRGSAGDAAWAAAVVMRGGQVVAREVRRGRGGAPYSPGLLALRLGPLMEEAVSSLTTRPDVLLVDATARDHRRRGGFALHLGSELDVPTVGITHRPLIAQGEMPADTRGATSPLSIDGEVVACWMRTRAGVRPVVVHPGWRVDLDTAVAIVGDTTGLRRTPEPLRRARRLARIARQQTPASWTTIRGS